MKYPKLVLEYVPLGNQSIKLVVYSDRLFDTNKDGRWQEGYLIFMADKDNRENVIDYATKKSRIVIRSVLGAETYGLTDTCD